MRATHFHVSTQFQRRLVDLSSAAGAAGWRAAQSLMADGARVIVRDLSGREQAEALEQMASDRGLGNLVIQRGSEPRGELLDSPDLVFDPSKALVVSVEPALHASGHVTLVGGGPGDPDLLTTGALKAIAHADVIFLDRLGIALNVCDIAPGALVIDVGKAPGRHKLSQERINEEMTAFAKAGAHVVRLKGGDVFVFGRGGEEWRHLASHNVPVSVIPGITSALSVPAHAGVSATLRNVTRAVTIISGHQPFNAAELRALVDLGGTIVILMGIATFPSTVAGLREAGLPDDTGVALLEQGFTEYERHTFTTLGTAIADARHRDVKNPAIIVIGRVVNDREPSAHIPDPAN